MAVGLSAPGPLHAVQGIRLAATHCGIKNDATVKDLTLVEIAAGATVAGVFTKSHFCAAPVILCRRHLAAAASARYLLINSGNANAATGQAGIDAALDCCSALAAATGVEAGQVLPFSTGVIAEPLPVAPVKNALPQLVAELAEDNWLAAAQGIMTTDTLPKAVSAQLEVDGRRVTVTGMAKGSGMIKPDMATMLSYVATDAEIAADELQAMLERLVAGSFNCISVDGDTSTNDSCLLIATGAAGVSLDRSHAAFYRALEQVFQTLAQSIIRDGEGATKFVEIRVNGAASSEDARGIAFTIAESPLVKTALFASDPNWGRFIMAIGRAQVSAIDTRRLDLYLGSVRLLHQGLPDPDYREERGQAEMAGAEISVRVELNIGEAEARVWTTDLSYDYVKINAEYRS